MLNCMRQEGAPESCITFFPTGDGKERCMSDMRSKMMEYANRAGKYGNLADWSKNWGKNWANWNKCSDVKVLKR